MNQNTFTSARLSTFVLGFGIVVWMIWIFATRPIHDLNNLPTTSDAEFNQIELQSAVPASVRSKRTIDHSGQPAADLLSVEASDGLTVEFMVVAKGREEPLENATIQLGSPGSLKLLGLTDAGGKLLVILPDSSVHAVTVSKSGFAKEVALLSIEEDESIVKLALRSAVSLEGQILMPDGSPSGAGVHVVAWPASAPQPTWSEFEGWLSGNETSLIGAETGPDGYYSIPDAAHSGAYRIAVGTTGYTTGWVTVRAGGNPAKIYLNQLVGIQVKISKKDGSIPQLTFPDHGLVVSMPGRTPLEGLSGKEARLALSNLPEVISTGQYAFDQLMLFYALVPLNSMPTVKIGTNFPGYSQIRADVDLRPIADEVEVRILQLEELPTYGRGTVQIKFAGYAISNSDVESLPLVELELISEDQTWGARYSISSITEPFIIEGLPYGNYTFKFSPFFQLTGLGNSSSQLSGGLTVNSDFVELPIDLSGFGAIEFKTFADDHRLATLHLEFSITSANGRPGETILPCFGGLCRVDLVPPGEYLIGEDLIASHGPTLSFDERLTVLPGAVSEVVVRVSTQR